MSEPAFLFKRATTTRGVTSSGEGSAEFWHPLLPVCMEPANGWLTILNGYNANRKMADVFGYDGTTDTAIELLQMRAPRSPLMPAVSAIGSGRIFGRGYFWRYRWRNSRTGEFSGLSPLPTWRVDLGSEQPIGGTGYLGQMVFFVFDVTDRPPNADTLELFRNASSRSDIVYKVLSESIAGATTVTLVDNLTDDEILVGTEIVSIDVPSGPTWGEGVMPPVAKARVHASKRTFYWGQRRWGEIAFPGNTLAVTQGSDLVTLNATVAIDRRIMDPGRVGQRIRFFSSGSYATEIYDPTVYRILKIESETTFRVYPEIQLSDSIASGGTANWYYVVTDDRDSRWTWMSEPGLPWLIDPNKTIATGDDYDDGVMAWFNVGTTLFCQTRRRIYAAYDDATIDPSLSIQFQQVSDAGCVGLDAGCETPFGWVFVNEKRGVCLFDGATVSPLERDATPRDEFLPRTQFQGFEPAALESVVCAYDPDERHVIVSYVPVGGSVRREVMVFSTPELNWRGQMRNRITAAGVMRSSDSSDKFVVGDGHGNLIVREDQALDVAPTSPNTLSLTGVVSSVQSVRIFTSSAATFNADSDERLRGCPIWFYDSGADVYYLSTIADVLSGTKLELAHPPISEDGATGTVATGWTYGIGSIRWEVRTASIDGGEPAFPKIAKALLLRFARGGATTTFKVGCSSDLDGSFHGERESAAVSPEPTVDVNGVVYADVPLEREGVAFQLRLRGTSRTGDPKITTALLQMAVSTGNPS